MCWCCDSLFVLRFKFQGVGGRVPLLRLYKIPKAGGMDEHGLDEHGLGEHGVEEL